MLEPIRAALQWTDDQLVASARTFFGQDPPDTTLARLALQRNTAPLADGQFDQQVPEGIRNPYWEVVRHLPAEKDLWRPIPTPHGFWFGCDHVEMVRLGLWREHLVYRYAWSIPSPGDLVWIKEQLGGRGVLEIGAGTGYWAWQMRQYGIDVLAYDLRSPLGRNPQVGGGPYGPVIHGGVPRASLAEDRALFLCWPTYRSNWAHRALKLYQGDLLIHAGEIDGCTADGGFFKELAENWEEVSVSPLHVTYFGIWCRLSAWRRL